MILKLENGLDVYLGSIQPPGVTKTDKGMNFAVAFDKREPFILKIWADGQCFEIPKKCHEMHMADYDTLLVDYDTI